MFYRSIRDGRLGILTPTLLAAVAFSGLAQEGAAQEGIAPLREASSSTSRVELIWDTPKELETPESVLYDDERDVIYVSNAGGDPSEKDGRGFISKLWFGGKILEPQWITGLNAPKGLALFGERLFVADIDQLVEINVKKGTITARYPAAGADALNDVTVNSRGEVFVSNRSPQNPAIYRLSDGRLAPWLQEAELGQPNGLLALADALVAGNASGQLLRIDYRNREIQTMADLSGTIRGIDGIAPYEGGTFLVSDWEGTVLPVRPEEPILGVAAAPSTFEVVKILDQKEKKINAADISYSRKRDMLLVPTFFDNRVLAYRMRDMR